MWAKQPTMPSTPHLDRAPHTGLPAEALRSPAQLRHAHGLATTLREPLNEGNRVELLVDGLATQAAMFDAIDAARDHINLEGGTLAGDGFAQALSDRLIRKRRQGVKINLLTDALAPVAGPDSSVEALARAGVRICGGTASSSSLWKRRFGGAAPPRRRKLLIVDGRVAFTGGIGVSGAHDLRRQTQRERWPSAPLPWRDTHVRVQGPLVARLQTLFIAHWQRDEGERPVLAHYFPPLAAAGDQCAIVATGDGERRGSFYRALLRAVELAQRRVRITASRFMPPARLLQALCAAAQRGVAVELVLPSVGDDWVPLTAMRSHYTRLLQAGVRIHERLEALRHATTAVIDSVWTAMGSGSLDWRSLTQDDDEAHLVVLDQAYAAGLEQMFEHDVARSLEIEPDEWQRRGSQARLMEALARPIALFL
jgi:cardiolipin synthase